MAQNKFGYWIKTIPSFKDHGQGNYRQGTEMDREFFGFDLNVRLGTFYNSGILEPFRTQICDYDQMMLWMGTDTNDLGMLGGQVEFCIGEEKDKHIISTATAISIPKGLPHLPVTIGPMDSRFIQMTASMTSEVKAEPTLADKPIGQFAPWRFSKYSKNIAELGFKRNGPWHYGPKNPDTNGGYITDIDAVGFEFNMSYEGIV